MRRPDALPFREPPDTAVYVCRHVLRESAQVLFVSCGEDGTWQFLCGARHGEGSGELPVQVCLGDVVEGDASLLSVACLPPGGTAHRERADAAWAFVPLLG